jgi:TatD DNase family protein
MKVLYQNGVWASVGLHPNDNKKEIFDYEKYKKLAQSKKVVAIGECGLDFLNVNEQDKERQKDLLIQQLKLASELNLPVILHCRKAHSDLIEILKLQTTNYKLQAVIHCFTGSWEEAQQYMELGFYLGFNGIIFKMDLAETIKKMPLERMLLETDCPYLLPSIRENLFENSRELVSSRNEPANVKYIAQKIAEIRGESLEKIAETTTQNAKNLFKLNYE